MGDKEITCIEDCQLLGKRNTQIIYFEIPAAANELEPQLLVKQAGGDNVVISESIYEGKFPGRRLK